MKPYCRNKGRSATIKKYTGSCNVEVYKLLQVIICFEKRVYFFSVAK